MCTQNYLPDLVKLFYANLSSFNDYNGNSVITSHVCGISLRLTIPSLCVDFGLKDEGKRIYISQDWPHDDEEIEEFEKYHEWFYCWQAVDLTRFSATDLPAHHRFLFLIINNILAPKKTIKTNVEKREVFMLRSILEKKPTLNIPYIILAHMAKARKSNVMAFPYGHLICWLLCKRGLDPSIRLWGQDRQESDVVAPKNLIHVLKTTGWHLTKDNHLITHPSDKRNDWLYQPGAKPNQYVPVGKEPTPSSSSSSRAQAGSNPDLIAYLDAKFNAINTTLDTKFEGITSTIQSHGARIENLEKGLDKWKEDEARHHAKIDASIANLGTDVQKLWGEMETQFKDVMKAIKKEESDEE